MSPITSRTRRLTRKRAAVGSSLAVLLAAGLWAAPSAFGTHYESSLDGNGKQAPSQFQIDNDANLTYDTSTTTKWDWGNVAQSFQVDKPTGQTDNSYQGGVKEDTSCPSETTGSIPNNKSDLLQFGTYVEQGSPGYLHMYWVRVNEPSGTTLMDFEFNQSKTNCSTGPNKVRTQGDMLIEYSIVQGGAKAVMTLRRWDATAKAWGTAKDITADANAAGTINSTAIAAGTDQLDLDGNGTLDPMPAMSPRTFGEASVDLNEVFDSTKCQSFGSAMLKSRSSDSFTSQLKDFISPVSIDLTNCGKVQITKQTDPNGSTTKFDYTKSFATDPSTDNTFQLADDQTKTFDNVLFGSDYTVTEDALPAGWTFDNLNCSASTGDVSYTLDQAARKVTFSIADANDFLKCTYYNKALASLTIVKQVSDDPGSTSFGFTSTGGLSPSSFTLTPTAKGAAGADSKVYSNISTGDYTVAETVPAGWNLTSATCDNGNDPTTKITLAAGDSVTCTFVNARERGAILITKTRKHAAATGGEGPHAGVTFKVSGTNLGETKDVTVVTDATGKACVSGLLYGSYKVDETVPAGYVNANASKNVTVSAEANCGADVASAATVSFRNTPLTDITVSVNSQIDGGTASTISCVDKDGNVVKQDLTNAPGDVSLEVKDLTPTAPDATLVCTIKVDP